MTGSLVLARTGPVAEIVITNPAKRNAMTVAMWAELPQLLAALAPDPDLRAVVLSGAGRTFCAGADISEAPALARAGETSLAVEAERALAAFPHPTIARIDGFCVGGGCQLAVACDLRFAARDARFGVTPAKLGIVYPPSTTRRLAALVGPSRVKLLLYTADLIDAPTAERFGLVDALFAPEDLAASVAAIAATIAERSRLTQRAAKLVLDGLDPPAQDEPELAEGVAAFLERRPPSFRWRP